MSMQFLSLVKYKVAYRYHSKFHYEFDFYVAMDGAEEKLKQCGNDGWKLKQ